MPGDRKYYYDRLSRAEHDELMRKLSDIRARQKYEDFSAIYGREIYDPRMTADEIYERKVGILKAMNEAHTSRAKTAAEAMKVQAQTKKDMLTELVKLSEADVRAMATVNAAKASALSDVVPLLKGFAEANGKASDFLSLSPEIGTDLNRLVNNIGDQIEQGHDVLGSASPYGEALADLFAKAGARPGQVLALETAIRERMGPAGAELLGRMYGTGAGQRYAGALAKDKQAFANLEARLAQQSDQFINLIKKSGGAGGAGGLLARNIQRLTGLPPQQFLGMIAENDPTKFLAAVKESYPKGEDGQPLPEVEFQVMLKKLEDAAENPVEGSYATAMTREFQQSPEFQKYMTDLGFEDPGMAFRHMRKEHRKRVRKIKKRDRQRSRMYSRGEQPIEDALARKDYLDHFLSDPEDDEGPSGALSASDSAKAVSGSEAPEAAEQDQKQAKKRVDASGRGLTGVEIDFETPGEDKVTSAQGAKDLVAALDDRGMAYDSDGNRVGSNSGMPGGHLATTAQRDRGDLPDVWMDDETFASLPPSSPSSSYTNTWTDYQPQESPLPTAENAAGLAQSLRVQRGRMMEDRRRRMEAGLAREARTEAGIGPLGRMLGYESAESEGFKDWSTPPGSKQHSAEELYRLRLKQAAGPSSSRE